MSGYQIVRELGRGSSGIVYLVRRRSDGRFFAAKEILFSDKEEHDQIMAEVQLMHSLPQHPSLLSLEDVLESRSSITMVLEYSQEGTLRELVYGSKDDRTQGLAEEDVVRYVTQLVNALAFLHSNDVLHRDIKLENLLLFSQRAVVKISDFGTSTILGRTATGHDRMAQTTAGTPNYMSPEVCEGSPYNFKSDVWSLGIVAYEMCCQAVPFQANNLLALTGKICHQATPDLPHEYSRRLNAIIKAMLTKNQHSRPSMKEVATMFQYYRRKLADGSPDGPDIGGFTVDSTILPNLLDDDDDYLLTDDAVGPKSPTLGAPSLGAPEAQDWDDPMHDGFFHHQPQHPAPPPPLPGNPTAAAYRRETEPPYASSIGDGGAASGGSVYHTNDLLAQTSPAAGVAQSAAVVPEGTIVSTHSTMLQDPKSTKGFSPSIRQAIFSEARRQAQEQTRLHDDDEQLVTQRPKSPRLRSLIEELQEEMKKQSAKVDSLLQDHSKSSSGAYARGYASSGQQRTSPIPKSSSPPPPFVDPASTPTKIRKVPSPTRLPTPPPSPSQLPPSSPTEFSPRESDGPTVTASPAQIKSPRPADKTSTPRQHTIQRGGVGVPAKHSGAAEGAPAAKSTTHHNNKGAGTTSASPRDPTQAAPKATPRTAAERGGGNHTPPPASHPIRVPKSSPPADALIPPASGTTLPVGAVPARPPRTVTRLNSKDEGASKGKDAPYFPPCAQCIKLAKEHRASIVDGSAADTSSSAFYTIRQSKLYCSTCHAPLCAECSKIVHDPLTTTTNLQQLSISTSMDEGSGKNSLSGKRHNLFYLSLSDPSQPSPPVSASPAVPRPLSPNLAASPTNSQKRASVTFQPHSEGEQRRNHKASGNSQDKTFLGCCTFM